MERRKKQKKRAMSANHSPDCHLLAFTFAAEAYQDRIMTETHLPYLLHAGQTAVEVLMALAKNPEGLDLELAVQCALLHDVLENANMPYDKVQTIFGEPVAKGVLALSEDMSLPDELPVNLRLVDYLRRIRRQPREIWVVKMAERIVNLLHPVPENWGRDNLVRHIEESIAIHETLKEAHQEMAKRLMWKIEVFGKQYLNKGIR